jgi:2-keto-4-pentenoate hydratase
MERESFIKKMSEAVFHAYADNDQFRMMSIECDAPTIELAYEVQSAYTKKRLDSGEKRVGYKVACTSKLMQELFDVDEPFTGTLFGNGWIKDNVLYIDRRGIEIEEEVAYIIKKDIPHPLQSVEELKSYIASAHASVELPIVDFPKPNQVKSYDIIVNGAGSYRFIVGPELKDWDTLDDLDILLTCNGVEKTRGKGNATLGSQWNTLLWVVNTLLAQGLEIKAGHVIFNGSLGETLVKAEEGEYEVSFGDTKLFFAVKKR